MFKKLFLTVLISMPIISVAQLDEDTQKIVSEYAQKVVDSSKKNMELVAAVQEKITDEAKQSEFLQIFKEISLAFAVVEMKKQDSLDQLPEKTKAQFAPYLDKSIEELEKEIAAKKEQLISFDESTKTAVEECFASGEAINEVNTKFVQAMKNLSEEQQQEFQVALQKEIATQFQVTPDPVA